MPLHPHPRALRLTAIALLIAWPFTMLLLSKADLSIQRWAFSILGLLTVTTGAVTSVLLRSAERQIGNSIGLTVQFGGTQAAAGLSVITSSLQLNPAAVFGIGCIACWLVVS